MMLSSTTWIHLLIVAVCATAALTDTLHERIPNWLTLPALGVAIALHAALGANGGGVSGAVQGALMALLGALLCGLVPFFLFWIGAMGGGDVKLLAVIGAFVGFGLGLEIQLLSFVIASVYSLAMLTWQGKLWRTVLNTAALTTNVFLPEAKRKHVPQELMTKLRFGVPMFLAALLVLFVRSYFPAG